MNQPIFEVRERKSVLVCGIICTLLWGATAILVLRVSGADEIWAILYVLLVFGLFAVLGIYLMLAYFNHRLKVFSGGEAVYSSSLGKKTTFAYRDIVKVEQKYVKNAMSLTLKDVDGKRLAKVESNMLDYDKLCQWLNTQKQALEDSKTVSDPSGVSAGHQIEVEPVKVKGTGKFARAFLVLMGVFMLIASVGTFSTLAGNGSSEDTEKEAQWFDPTAEYEDKQMVKFELISYPFASFELSDSQGLYFVFDSDMCGYIVCMDNERLETEFKALYDYTFSDTAVFPGEGYIEGYAMMIEEDLKSLAIEEFNYLWGEDILTDANFEEYLGAYYLDSTYIPESNGESVAATILGGIFFLVLGVYLIYYGVKGYKKAEQKIAAQSTISNASTTAGGLKECALGTNGVVETAADTAAGSSKLSTAVNDANAEAASVTGAGDLTVPGNIFVALAASVICAAAGGLLWIVFYKLGRIAAISGYVAVFGAMYGYSKFGKRELKVISTAWCILTGVAMIVFANYISYTWEIVDAINASNPGRAEFLKVFINMPQMMTEWELWSSFLSDLAMGLIFALIAGISGLFGKKKQKCR